MIDEQTHKADDRVTVSASADLRLSRAGAQIDDDVVLIRGRQTGRGRVSDAEARQRPRGAARVCIVAVLTIF